MPGLRITKFGGMAPINSDHSLPKHMAVVAENVDLSRHTLRPWRAPAKVAEGAGRALWREECCTLTFDDCHASVAYAAINCGRVFAADTGHGYPVTAKVADACASTWCRLGFPCDIPAPVPAALAPAAFADNIHRRQLRSYVYRLRNAFGEMSQPSPASIEVEVDSTAVVTVTGIPAAFPGWCVEAVLIYRSEQELTYGADKQDIDGSFFLIGEAPLGTTDFSDDPAAVQPEDELDGEEFDEPPANLRFVRYWGDAQLSGLAGDALVFSLKHHYHAWPSRLAVTFHSTPRAWVVGKSTGYVLTDGSPAIVALKGDCEGGSCHQVRELDDKHPIVSIRSAVTYNDHAIYATKDGLLMISPAGQCQLLTDDYFARDQWQALEPWTMVGVVHDGHYFGFCRGQAIRLRIPDNVYEKPADIGLTTLTLRPSAVYRSDSDELYLLLADGVHQWNAGTTFMTLRWRGALLDMPAITAFAAYKVMHTNGGVTVRHWCDDELVDVEVVDSNQPQRLPLVSGLDWQAEIETSGEVREFHIASSVRDLAQGAG